MDARHHALSLGVTDGVVLLVVGTDFVIVLVPLTVGLQGMGQLVLHAPGHDFANTLELSWIEHVFDHRIAVLGELVHELVHIDVIEHRSSFCQMLQCWRIIGANGFQFLARKLFPMEVRGNAAAIPMRLGVL